MARLPHKSERSETRERQIRSEQKLQAPKNTKELMFFLGSPQHLSKFVNNLSKRADRMTRLLKKGVNWECTPEKDEDFKKLKKEITEAPCSAHFDPKRDNFITTDACITGLGQLAGKKKARFLDQ